MAFKAWHVPVRVATGAIVLNAGLRKRSADEETAKGLHGFATTAYPEFEDTPPEKFASMLSTGEIAVGALVLTPVVPTAVAGLALTTFAALLMRLYLKAPGLREEGSLQPTEQGTAIAKDVWMLAIGTALTIDGLTDRRSKRRKAKAAANGG
ncbi:MAG TPA: hypothetical protein VFR26_02040 [Acidimicrobiales bacterium]|nr:hypothetical protein [Acidimicrobiales bacterium]